MTKDRCDAQGVVRTGKGDIIQLIEGRFCANNPTIADATNAMSHEHRRPCDSDYGTRCTSDGQLRQGGTDAHFQLFLVKRAAANMMT